MFACDISLINWHPHNQFFDSINIRVHWILVVGVCGFIKEDEETNLSIVLEDLVKQRGGVIDSEYLWGKLQFLSCCCIHQDIELVDNVLDGMRLVEINSPFFQTIEFDSKLVLNVYLLFNVEPCLICFFDHLIYLFLAGSKYIYCLSQSTKICSILGRRCTCRF